MQWTRYVGEAHGANKHGYCDLQRENWEMEWKLWRFKNSPVQSHPPWRCHQRCRSSRPRTFSSALRTRSAAGDGCFFPGIRWRTSSSSCALGGSPCTEGILACGPGCDLCTPWTLGLKAEESINRSVSNDMCVDNIGLSYALQKNVLWLIGRERLHGKLWYGSD